ncbi:MAG: hypothetical protein ACO3ZY_09335 [Phycisphaerales bacterium]
MNPLLHDISYYRGTTDIASIEWQDQSGTPVNLTGYAAHCYVRSAAGTMLASTASEITATITAASGLIVLTITDAGGRGLPAGVHVYDVWAVSSGGIDYPLVSGSFTVIPEQRSYA